MKSKAEKNRVTKPFGLALGDTAAYLPEKQLNQEMATIANLGVTWIRIDVSWADVQPNNAQQYDWTGLDREVASAHTYGLKILGTLAYAPSWASASNCPTSQGQKCPPANDSQFDTFIAQVIKRYASQGLHSWEIWNEPNLQGFWAPTPSPLAYTALLKSAYRTIKQVDPEATVISGGLGPLDYGSHSIGQQTFLSAMYADGAQPYFDELGYHPYSYPAPPLTVEPWSGWSTMADLPNSIRDIMSANGDALKPIWITEYGAPTGGPGPIATMSNYNFNAGPDHVSEALQAYMLMQAASFYKRTPWLGNFFWYSYQDLSTSTTTNENFFGLLRHDGTKKPAASALQQTIANQ